MSYLKEIPEPKELVSSERLEGRETDQRQSPEEKGLSSLENHEIQSLLPHRYPMLLVDRVENIQLGEQCTGIKCVSVNEPFFIGHFPGLPIMPGVLIIEAMAQTAGVLVLYSIQPKTSQKAAYFMSIENARFRRPVLPGACLHLSVRKIHHRRNVWKFKCEARVGSTLHADATLTAMFTE